MNCSCPDWAVMCKHVAAVLYGVGVRLDADPELLFALRDVDHMELVGQAVAAENLDQALSAGATLGLEGADLGEVFGIELDRGATRQATAVAGENKKAARKSKSAPKKVTNAAAAIAKNKRRARPSSRKRSTAGTKRSPRSATK
jgi:uncharacterized Zn finger protein